MTTHGIYFKKEHDISAIMESSASLAKAHGVGTSASDILNALHTGELLLRPATDKLSMDARELSLLQILERAAAKLEASDPALSGELRRRKALLEEAL